MLEIFIFLQKQVNLERKTQHEVFAHANTSNGIKIPTFFGKKLRMMLNLSNASLKLTHWAYWLWTVAKIKTRKMSAWAKSAKISSQKNFYLYCFQILQHTSIYSMKLMQCGQFYASAHLQRHITGVLENTRVFDEKYPGIFQYPGFMMSHYRVIDKYPGIFHQIPRYLTACQIPG